MRGVLLGKPLTAQIPLTGEETDAMEHYNEFKAAGDDAMKAVIAT